MSESQGHDAPSSPTLDSTTLRIARDRILHLLTHGEMILRGQFAWSSNYTFLVTVGEADLQAMAVYKPAAGETPLWDFDIDTLCRREVAAYLVAQHLGWPSVPPTVLRDGPHGIGSTQLFIGADYEEHFFTLREDPRHELALRHVALYDYVTNNADRKGGHLLLDEKGQVWAIDHGLAFHVEDKLRTVIWDWAGEPISEDDAADLGALRGALYPGPDSEQRLVEALGQLLSAPEIAACVVRLDHLLNTGCYPLPARDRRNVPYPLI